MFEFLFLAKQTFEKSEEDCMSMESDIWELEDVTESNGTFNFKNSASASYISDRNRKKYSLNFCGVVDSSYFIFSDPEERKNINRSIFLNVSRNPKTKKYFLELKSTGERLIGKKQYKSSTDELCFSLISGRGYVGVFSMPYIEGKEPLILHELSIPRTHKFTYLSLKESNVSKLCIGDFFGNDRVDIDMDTEWNSHIHDFL